MRGVNKLIVEIKDTENEYFDRAILFIKPDKAAAEQSELDKSARKLLSAVRDGKSDKSSKKLLAAVFAVLGVIAAAAAKAALWVLT